MMLRESIMYSGALPGNLIAGTEYAAFEPSGFGGRPLILHEQDGDEDLSWYQGIHTLARVSSESRGTQATRSCMECPCN